MERLEVFVISLKILLINTRNGEVETELNKFDFYNTKLSRFVSYKSCEK